MYETALSGRVFKSGPDPRRNLEGRPRSLRRLIREALADDVETLVRFLVGVFRDDAAPMADQVAAAAALAHLAFGVQVGAAGRQTAPRDSQSTPYLETGEASRLRSATIRASFPPAAGRGPAGF